jgi:hypothetical protein
VTALEPDEFAGLDIDDAEQLAAVSDDDLAAALDWLHERNPLAGYCTPVTRPRKPRAIGRRVDDVKYRPAAPYPQTVRTPVDDTTPIANTYAIALDALRAHPSHTDALAAALDAVRAWRHMQPHSAALDCAPLDAVLDAALGSGTPQQPLDRPTSLQDAVARHRAVLDARRAAFDALRMVWDQIEAAALREMNRQMSRG